MCLNFSNCVFPDSNKCLELKEIVRKARSLSEERDKLVHSVWRLSADDTKPAIRFKEGKGDTEHRLEAVDLFKIAQRMYYQFTGLLLQQSARLRGL